MSDFIILKNNLAGLIFYMYALHVFYISWIKKQYPKQSLNIGKKSIFTEAVFTKV